MVSLLQGQEVGHYVGQLLRLQQDAHRGHRGYLPHVTLSNRRSRINEALQDIIFFLARCDGVQSRADRAAHAIHDVAAGASGDRVSIDMLSAHRLGFAPFRGSSELTVTMLVLLS